MPREDRSLIEQQIAELSQLSGSAWHDAVESLLADLRDGIADYGQRAERNQGTKAGEFYAEQAAAYRTAQARVEEMLETDRNDDS